MDGGRADLYYDRLRRLDNGLHGRANQGNDILIKGKSHPGIYLLKSCLASLSDFDEARHCCISSFVSINFLVH